MNFGSQSTFELRISPMIAARTRVMTLAILSTLVLLVQAESQSKPHYAKTRTAASHRHKAEVIEATPLPPPPPSPIPEMSLQELPPQTPEVAYANGRLTVNAESASLADICEAISKHTGTQIDTPPEGSERFAVHLAGTPREVISSLLNGSQLGYIILASPEDPTMVRKVVLTKLEPNTTPHSAPAIAGMPRRGMPMARTMAQSDDQEPPETTNSNGPNPAPLDTTVPFQPAPVGQASGSDQPAQQINAPGQFMQELYRLRQQQQQQQNQQNQPQAPPPQQ